MSEEVKDALRNVVEQYNLKKSAEILDKLSSGSDLTKLTESDRGFIQNASRQTDDSFQVRAISESTRSFGIRLNDANLDSFEKVEQMYQVGFYTGVALVLAGIVLFALNNLTNINQTDRTTSNLVSGLLGGLGVADMLLLLYTPVRELQKSRGNISKISALFNEWQFISIWSGKTYNALMNKLKSSNEFDSKTEKLLNEMKWMLELKSDVTIKLAKLMADVSTYDEIKTLTLTINSKPEEPEINTKIELEANVYGISTSDAEKITYLWTEESNKITINNNDKRKADFTPDKAGEYTIKVEVKMEDKMGSAISKIKIRPKITVNAEPEKTSANNTVKLIANVEGFEDKIAKTLSYKWEEVNGTGNAIADDEKAEASIKPPKPGNYEFKVTIKKDGKEFAVKQIKIEVT